MRRPATSIRSLTSSGTPASRPLTPARARAIARSPFVTMIALRSASPAIRSSASSITATGSSSPRPDELRDLGGAPHRTPAADLAQRGAGRQRLGVGDQLDQRRAARRPRALERGGELVGVLDPLAVGPVGAREAGEVGVGEVGGDHALGEAALLVHADRPVGAVVDDDHEDRQPLRDRGGELLPVHLEVAVAGERDHEPVGVQQLRGQRRRHAVAHRAALRAELGAEAPPLVVARDPAGEVAGAVGEDRVGGQRVAQVRHHLAEVDAAAGCGRVADVRLVVRARRRRPLGPARAVDDRRGGRELRHAAEDRERRLVDAPELARVGVDVHERLRRDRRRGQRVALRLDLGQPRADRDQQVAVADALREPRVDGDADVAGVARARVVDDVLAAERRAHRQPARERPARERARGRLVPRPAADEHERALGAPEHRLEPGQRGGAGAGRCGAVARRVGHVDRGREHVLGQREHDRPRPPARRHRVGAREHLGDALGVVDLVRPLRHRPEHGLVVELLEGLAPALARARSARPAAAAASSPAARCGRRRRRASRPGPRVTRHSPGRPVSLP